MNSWKRIKATGTAMAVISGIGVGSAIVQGCGSGNAAIIIAILKFLITRSAGGLVSDGPSNLNIPPNSLASDTTMTVQPATNLPPSPSGKVLIPGTAYTYGPAGTMFSPAATLTVAVQPGAVPTTVDPTSVTLYVITGGAWVEVPGSAYHPGNATDSVSASVQQVGTYAVFGALKASG